MRSYESFNKYLADIAVLNAKLHNLHWNVECRGFKQVHEFIEGIYDYVTETYDSVAEIMKMQGVFPMVKLADFLKVTGIEELDSRKFTCEEAWGLILEDLEYMRASALKIREEANEVDNFQVANEMEDHIETYVKHIWFIKAALA